MRIAGRLVSAVTRLLLLSLFACFTVLSEADKDSAVSFCWNCAFLQKYECRLIIRECLLSLKWNTQTLHANWGSVYCVACHSEPLHSVRPDSPSSRATNLRRSYVTKLFLKLMGHVNILRQSAVSYASPGHMCLYACLSEMDENQKTTQKPGMATQLRWTLSEPPTIIPKEFHRIGVYSSSTHI